MRIPLLGALVVMAIALAITAGPSSASSDGPSLPPGDTFGGIHMVAFQNQGDQPTTAAQFQLIARSDDMVVAGPYAMGKIAPQLKADNPSILLLVYENGMYSTKTDPGNLPESWFLHTATGQRVQSKAQGNWLMNPLSTTPFSTNGVTYDGWSDYVAKECARDQTALTSGCYLDMLGPGPLRSSYNVGGVVPVDPRTGKAFDPVIYEQLTGSVADVVRPDLPTADTLIGNGYSTGMAYYQRGTWQLNDYTDSAQAQTWLGNDDLTQSFKQWHRSVQMITDNGLAGSSMIVHYGPTGTSNLDPQLTFAVASYLLGNTGHAYFDYMANGLHTWESWSPLYDLQLGTPLQTAPSIDDYLIGGVYQRAYTGGIVLVNPNSGSATVNLGARYTTASGSAVTSLTVAGHSAAILTN